MTTPEKFPLPSGVVDAWINPNLGALTNAATALFPDLAARMERGTTLEQLIDEMDAAGVAKGVLCSGYAGEGDREWCVKARDRHPERFALSHVVDPREGMAAVRLVEELVTGEGHRLIRLLGLQTQLYYNDPAYYPVYAKCVELGVPVSVNVGFPGPHVPSKYQDPLSVDDVCAFFPDLKVVLAHGGEPWVDVCVKLMVKWPNVSWMSSAIAPKHIPPAILQYANTRGADRVMWGSDYPLLTHERCLTEALRLPFRDAGKLEKFLSFNASAMFFA